jgi:putative transcriptional regulator
MTTRLSPPNPDRVREARLQAGLTQSEAASVVHSTGRRWREWEAGDHRMPPASWELFLLRTQAVIFTEPAELADMPPVKE